MPKPRIGRMVLALPLMFGVVPAVGGYQLLRDLAAEQTALIFSSAVLFLSGATMLVSAAWLFVSLGQRQFPLLIGGIASLLSGGVIAAATVSHVFPCSTPT